MSSVSCDAGLQSLVSFPDCRTSFTGTRSMMWKELHQHIKVWDSLDQRLINSVIREWCKTLWACVGPQYSQWMSASVLTSCDVIVCWWVVIGTLHVGDEIQDINGCCVDGQSLDSLQTLLVCGFTCCIVSNVCIRVQRSDRPRRDGLQTKLYPKWVYEGSNYEKVLCAINVSFA